MIPYDERPRIRIRLRSAIKIQQRWTSIFLTLTGLSAFMATLGHQIPSHVLLWFFGLATPLLAALTAHSAATTHHLITELRKL